MAPKSHSDEKIRTPKHRLVHFKHNRPKSSYNRPCSKNSMEKRRDIVSRSSTNVKPPENYENLLLFYLTKLKNLFSNTHPEPAARENSAVKMNKLHHNHYLRSTHRASSVAHPCRYTSSNPPKPREDEVQSKVYKVVSAALEYGYANNVLERKGDYFFLKNRRPSVATRQPTPGPRYCQRCCNVHQFVKTSPEDDYPARFSKRHRPMQSYCDKPLHSIEEGNKVDRNYRERSNSLCFHGHGYCGNKISQNKPQDKLEDRFQDSLKANIHHCPECRALERVRK